MSDITELDLVKAMEQHAKASDLEKQAKKLKEDARAVILDWASSNMGVLLREGGELERAGFKTQIVIPIEKGEPRRFDQAQAEKLRDFLLDLYGDTAARFFDAVYTFKLDEFLDACHEGLVKPTGPALVRIDKDMLPATGDEPMSPRVSTKRLS